MLSKKYTALRWIFLSVSIATMLWITYMNFQYVDKVRNANQEAFTEKKKEQVREFVSQVRTKFISVPRSIWAIDPEVIKTSVDKNGMLPNELNLLIADILSDSLYSEAFFTTSSLSPCETKSAIWKFDLNTKSFFLTHTYPELVCDGLNLAQTRMKVLMEDYRWNTKTTFDTHRSMNIALMYPPDKKVIGYLTLVIDSDFLVHSYLRNEIERLFGTDSEENEVSVWINDWVKEKVLYTNNTQMPLDFRKVQITERFPGMLDNWNVLTYVHEPKNQHLIEYETGKNLIIISLSFFLLLGSLLFIIYSAKKEQEISKRQSEFLSNVTHELKTPLAVIQAAGENLKDRRVKNEDRVATYGRHIYDEALRLKTMIEKLLDIARSDANLTQAHQEKLNPNSVLQTVLNREMPLLQSKGFEVQTQFETSEFYISIDRGHFETILSNLIENSVKYSRDRFFLLITTKIESNKVYIMVQDQGIGIPKSALNHIFEKFYRVEDTLTAQTKGHGLGLSIVKHLTELNNGIISVESTYMKGTTFTLEFPLIDIKMNQQKKLNKELTDTTYAKQFTESVL